MKKSNEENEAAGRQTAKGRTMEGRTVEGRTMEGKPMEGRTMEGRTMEEKTLEGRTVEGRTMEGKPMEGISMEGRTVEARHEKDGAAKKRNDDSYRHHVEKLKGRIEEYGKQPVCLAFSGGVDSSVLLKLLCEQAEKTGALVCAVTFDTMLHPACDLENARRVAAELNAVHVVLKVDELELEPLRSNPVNRCYLCKRHLFETLKQYAAERGITLLVDGTNEDDLHMYRPGLKALEELGIESPLASSHMTKDEVKRLAAKCGISAASRPSTPCMATRLPYGAALDYGLLKKIEEGEGFLRTVFSGNIRLRVHGSAARLELDPDQMEAAVRKRAEVTGVLKSLGFDYITLDLEGFRSGSMDLHVEEK